MIRITSPQKRALKISTALAIVVCAYFLKYYLMLIIFAAIIALLFNPFYKWRLRRGSKPSNAASQTLIVSILALVIPLALVTTITTYQVVGMANHVSEISKDADIRVMAQDTIDSLNQFFKTVGVPYVLHLSDVVNAISAGLKKFGGSLASSALSSIGSIGAFFATIIIYFYVFLGLLKSQNDLVDGLQDLNPLGKDIGALYINKATAMTKAMVRGQFVIAICQGFVGAITIYLAGIHNAFFFFFVLLTALSVIPLGGGIVALPLGAILLLTGNIWGGLIIILGHLLVVTNIDNILRPKLVPSEARLNPALTILAVFSGLKFFGFIGIVVGPVLMIILITTIQVFLKVYKHREWLEDGVDPTVRVDKKLDKRAHNKA